MDRRVLGGAAAGIAVAAAAALSLMSESRSVGSAHATPASGLARHFDVLAKPAPGDGAHGPFAAGQNRLNVDLASVRRADVPGRDVWIAARNDGELCVSVGIAPGVHGGGCTRASGAEVDGFFTTSHPAPTDVSAEGLAAAATDLTGIVPDGVSSVTVELANGTGRELAVTDNAVSARFAQRPVRAIFTDATGAHRVTKLAGA